MQWTEASRTLRYLYRPLATHVHILLISCLLVALGLGAVQNGSSSQGRPQAVQTPHPTELSTGPTTAPQTGSGSNTDVPVFGNGPSGLYEGQSQPQPKVTAPANPLAPPVGVISSPNAMLPSCDGNPCTASSPAPAISPDTPDVDCTACRAANRLYRLHHPCAVHCPSMPGQDQ
jgi:hypothetical protein